MRHLTLLLKPVGDRCCLRCDYCFYRSPQPASVMTPQTVDMLIEKIRQTQPSALSVVFQGGEPLLAGLAFFRAFTKKIRAAIDAPVSFAAQTNGLLLDDAFAAFFREQRFLVGVSLDGDRTTHDRHRHTKDGEPTFDRVIKAIETLKAHGVDYNILSVVTDKSAKEIDRTWAFFRAKGFRFLQFIPCLDAGNVSLSAEKYAFFLKRSFDLWYDAWEQGDYISVRHIDNYIRLLLGEPPENCAMCGVCGSYFAMEADGSLYPCDFYCRNAYRLGSVFEDDPFRENEIQRSFLAASETIHAHCQNCKYHFLCRGGCRADRIENGTKNKYCSAYRAFFESALARMQTVARQLLR